MKPLLINTHMQVNKIVYFALLVKHCAKKAEPTSDSLLSRKFEEALSSFKLRNKIENEYEQNPRSVEYLITMSKELEIIFKNNKLTPWGSVLSYFTSNEIKPLELPVGFKIFFLKCLLLENYAFIKSLYDHIEKFSEIIDEIDWYNSKHTYKQLKGEIENKALSVYVHALKIAIESVNSIRLRRRYLRLYKTATKSVKTAKALYHKIKPTLGFLEDLGFLNNRHLTNNRILFLKEDDHSPYIEIMQENPTYKKLVESDEKTLLSCILNAYGFKGKKRLTSPEIQSDLIELFKQICDPVFKVCDINTLISIIVIQKGLQGYELNENEVMKAIINASIKDRRLYQMLPDRSGKNRFLKIKI